MERLSERLLLAEQTVATLEEVLTEPFSKVARDAAIQRFEYSFEAIWKAAAQYLREMEGIDAASPKSVIRACHGIKMFGDESAQLAMEMADERNMTVHTYNEKLAQAIYALLPRYAALMKQWLAKIKEKIA